MVPPPLGCGWQTSAAHGALGAPSLSRASSRPAGPRKSRLRSEVLSALASGSEKEVMGFIPRSILRVFHPERVCGGEEIQSGPANIRLLCLRYPDNTMQDVPA